MGVSDSNVLTGLAGGVLCLFGFSLYMGGLRIVGMFLGGSIGGLIGLVIAYTANLEGGTALLVFAIAALIGAALGWRFLQTLHRFLILLIGAGLGFLLGQFVLPDLGGMWAEPWVPFASVIAGAILFSFLFRYIIILVTSAVGSYLLFQATELSWVMALAFAIGLVVQIAAFHGLNLDRRVQVSKD